MCPLKHTRLSHSISLLLDRIPKKLFKNFKNYLQSIPYSLDRIKNSLSKNFKEKHIHTHPPTKNQSIPYLLDRIKTYFSKTSKRCHFPKSLHKNYRRIIIHSLCNGPNWKFIPNNFKKALSISSLMDRVHKKKDFKMILFPKIPLQIFRKKSSISFEMDHIKNFFMKISIKYYFQKFPQYECMRKCCPWNISKILSQCVSSWNANPCPSGPPFWTGMADDSLRHASSGFSADDNSARGI